MNEPSGDCRLLCELARHMLRDFPGVPDELRLQINSALVGEDENRPQAIRKLMAELGMAIIDGADASVRLDQLCQVSDITDEAERKFLCRPDAPPIS